MPAAIPKITYEKSIDGYLVWSGNLKVAVLTTKYDSGPRTEGDVVYKKTWVFLERADWGLHFTSPSASVGLLEAIVKSLPTEP